MIALMDLLRRYADSAPAPSLKCIEDLLRQVRFDGPVTIYYRGGIPQRIEAGKPIMLRLQQEHTEERDLTSRSG